MTKVVKILTKQEEDSLTCLLLRVKALPFECEIREKLVQNTMILKTRKWEEKGWGTKAT